MKPRINYAAAAPEAYQAVKALDAHVRSSGIEPSMLDLVNIRTSQLNGCSFCIYLHTAEARKRGESEERLYLLSAWRESSLYSGRERAALEWTDALTFVSEAQVPDEIYERVRHHFSEEELVKLTIAISSMNALNRLAISMRAVHPTRNTR